MSKSHSKISPARSQGFITPQQRTRRTLSSASPAQSEGRLSTVVEKFVKSDRLVLSPMKRRSVLPDDTDIEAPRRASWWKKLEGSSRDVLEALDTNKMPDNLLEEYEFEVEKDNKQSQSDQQSQSSDNESVASIVVPQRRLFDQKKQTQAKFGDIMGSRKSLGRTNIEDQSIEVAPKNLFNKGPRNRPVFPAALLNSTNKTINKTVEPEINKQTRPNLFGQAGTKRKNMFTDFVLSDDSEGDSEVQHKVFGFKKNNKRMSLGTRSRRMPSLTPSMTTEIDIDDWNLLPSSTMIGAQEASQISDKDIEMQDENQDNTLTDDIPLNHTNNTSVIQDEENDKTLTNENIDVNKTQDGNVKDVSKRVNKTREKSKLNSSAKDKSLQNKSTKPSANSTNTKNMETEEVIVEQQQNNTVADKNTRLADNEQSLEDKMAEIHGESVEIEKSRLNTVSNKTGENIGVDKSQDVVPKDVSKKVNQTYNKSKSKLNTSVQDKSLQNKSTTQATNDAENMEEVVAKQQQNNAAADRNALLAENERSLHGEMAELHGESVEIEKSRPNEQDHKNGSEAAHKTNHVEDMGVMSGKNKSKDEIDADIEEPEINNSKKEIDPTLEEENQVQSEACKTNEDKDKSKEEEEKEESEQEHSEEEQEQSEVELEKNEVEQEHSEEEQEQSEVEADQSEVEPEQSEEEQEQSEEEQEPSEVAQEESEEEQQESEEEQEPSLDDQENENQTDEAIRDQDEEMPPADQDEEMEEMVWNDNDEDKLSDVAEKELATKSEQISKNLSKLKHIDKSKNITNKSHKIVDESADNDKIEDENDVVEGTPNNSTHDTTGRNRKKDVSKIKSPEAVLQNITTDNESFRPIGRSTTFRKSKSVYGTMNMGHSLAPDQESTLGNEGSRNSSTEGSEWDSHRTTRKTIRQTLGKEYTTRKSLRALVMEQSAKRQTELYNRTASKFDKTKNKTVTEDGNDKNASKMNKTVVEDGNNKNASTINKTQNKTVIDDANNDNASNKTKNKTVSEDIDHQHIRFRRSNRVSSNQSPNLKSPVHDTSIHHVPDPLISEHQVSYHKSRALISEIISNPDQSVSTPDNNDSGPEISMNASYGQGMSASGHEMQETADKIINKDNSRRSTSIHSKSLQHSEEVLDYEASEQVISGLEGQDDSEHESMNEKESEPENEEIEQSKQEAESEVEHEDSQQEIEADSEHETQEEIEESQQEIVSDQEEIEDEHEESQQEIESEQDMVDEQDESQQEIDEQDQSQQEIESDQEESQQEIESEHEQESENDVSQEQESDHDIRNYETDQDDDFISALNSKFQTPEKRGASRVVFDSNMMSVDEIDFEGVSRQTNDVTENTESERESELRHSGSFRRASEPRVQDVSVGTKKSMLMMQLQKITQENEERRMKIRESVQKSLKPTRYNFNATSPVQRKYSIRRMTEPKKPRPKAKPTGVPTDTLPKAFYEDLMYKPPKRFQPATAPWITKRLYKFLETKLEPKYDYRARIRAEELVQTIFSFAKLVRRHDAAPAQAVEELKKEMARLRVVTTHYEFYDFFHEFMPREIRIKVNPDVVNRIPMPRNGIFSEILPPRSVVE
ncbi:probable WRKY transcription factor protein 1 [Leguminivora glycinivorella]|uniref:probable WRKY transcription factor protein 1 n=1 Tax=Leguminivora glycinivorella TaxID=1035111 RepID=UPI00200DEB08|nr:probable WRKY transcription factor protein 1 [Leguminivora glycinivorella]